MEVTVSPDPDDPHRSGSVALVKDGYVISFQIAQECQTMLLRCRNRDFASIIPHQPARYRNSFNEVFLDFEAFLLANMKERSTLWIHSQIKACMDPTDCQPEFCLDLFEPQGNGRRRRRSVLPEMLPAPSALTHRFSSNQSAKFAENIEYTVLMPGGKRGNKKKLFKL